MKVLYRTAATWHRVIRTRLRLRESYSFLLALGMMNCWDNACSETLFGSLKVERLHGMRFETRRRTKDEIIDWLVWYNSRRLHSTLG